MNPTFSRSQSGHFSRRAAFGMAGAALAGHAFAADTQPPNLPSSGVNVRDHGAKGDGVTDDTAAFEAALNEGRSSRRPAFVPDGRYRLTRPLSIHAQGLVGNPWGSWVADVAALPTLLPESLEGPALTLEAGGSVAGIEIRYPNDDPAHPMERPAAIRLGETGATVRWVKISHPWIGIDTVPVHTNPGRTVVENIFIAGAHHLGLHFTGAADVCLFRNIEVWTPPESSGTFLTSGTAFHFQRGDGVRLTDCFAFGANRGYLFTKDSSDGPLGGVFTGYLSNCLGDFCNTGIEVRGDHRLTITGGGNWSHHSCIRLEEGSAILLASAVEMFSNANAAVFVGSAAQAVFQGCGIERKHPDFPGPAVHLTGGERVIFGHCVLRSPAGPAVQNEMQSGRLVMTGNSFEGEIVDRSGGSAQSLAEANLMT
ncbi:MAG: hypothetical protein KDM63_07010 [Verrucomicrobiae bacterium]|nr:hypothetical protein [Verrucomicrobiae bacterium]